MIGTERLRTRISDAPAGWSRIFVTFFPSDTGSDYSDHDTTGLSVTFGGAVDWKPRQLTPIAYSTTEYRNSPLINASNGMSGCLGGAQGVAWFVFCLLSSG
jgi:hypothetical protein